jgi:hypothetical protein
MIILVSATQKDSQSETLLYTSVSRLPDDNIWGSAFITNNTRGLSEVYNEAINAKEYVRTYYDNDILLFCHDDLIIEDQYLEEKLENALTMFDVVGVAGTRSYQLGHPNVWHKCPKEHMVGVVNHDIDGKYYSTYFGPSPSPALIIDGIFIAVKVKTFRDNPTLRFHNDLTFHFYDLYFSLKAYSLKLKVGVYPISVCHHSAGNWTDSKVWHDTEPVFEKICKEEFK